MGYRRRMGGFSFGPRPQSVVLPSRLREDLARCVRASRARSGAGSIFSPARRKTASPASNAISRRSTSHKTGAISPSPCYSSHASDGLHLAPPSRSSGRRAVEATSRPARSSRFDAMRRRRGRCRRENIRGTERNRGSADRSRACDDTCRHRALAVFVLQKTGASAGGDNSSATSSIVT